MGASKELEIMIQAVKSTGNLLLERIGSKLYVEEKWRNEFVTNVDKEAEDLILTFLKKEFPGYGLYSEEAGNIKEGEEYQWIVDPLDGTHNYLNGWLQYGVSIVLTKNDQPIKAVTYLPSQDILTCCEKGQGVFQNGKKVKVSEKTLDKAMVIIGMKVGGETYEKIRQKVPFVRTIGCATVSYTGLANGTFTALVFKEHKKYDLAQGLLYVPEAGGKITDHLGKPCSLETDYIIASNSLIHNDLVSLLNDDLMKPKNFASE